MPEMSDLDEITVALAQRLRKVMLEITSKRIGDPRQYIDYLLEVVQKELAVSRVSLWLFERGGQRLTLRQERHDDTIKFLLSPEGRALNSLDRQSCANYFSALKSNFCVDVEDALHDSRTLELVESYLIPTGIVSLMDAPVRALGSQMGVMCVESTASRKWHLLEQSFAAGMATQISLALERDELAQANQSLIKRAMFDQLTGLPNFLQLDDELRRSLGELTRGGDGVGLVYADVEQFLLICNSLGIQLAQALLVGLAQRLRGFVSDKIFLARAGDDDFAFIVRDQNPLEAARVLAEAVVKSMTDPIMAEHREVLCALSVGYCARAEDDNDLSSESLLREGWSASRAARRSGLPKVFERAQLIRAALEVELEQELRKALREHRFEPHLQPIFDLQTRKIYGFEALLRWRDPVRGVITPVEFMGVAQRSGLIVPIGQQLVAQTIKAFARMCATMPNRDLRLYINLSPPEFLRDELLDEIKALLRKYSLPAKCLALEITESVIIEDMAKAQCIIKEFHDLGVGVHLDDLGTGFSSLNYLRVLPVDGVKLDYSFTFDIERNSRSAALVKALVGLSRELNQDLVAEGVEWEGQLCQLRLFGIRHVQGYLLARPTNMTDIDAEWIVQTERCAQDLFDRMDASLP
jgi:diguanylate cyclase (GGDEF)-like protein